MANRRYGEWPNCLSETAVKFARFTAHSASSRASRDFPLSGFGLAERSALWILLWGLGSFTTFLLFTDGCGHSPYLIVMSKPCK